MLKIVTRCFLLVFYLLIGGLYASAEEVPISILKTKVVDITINDIGSWISIHNMIMHIDKVFESKTIVDGPYSENEYFTFHAEQTMKYIVFHYEIINRYNRIQSIPSVDFGEFETDKGNVYECWSPNLGIQSKEYKPSRSTKSEIEYFIGQSEPKKSLLPGETTVGIASVYIPEGETIKRFKLANIKDYILLEF